jgi:hypothetical protein
LPVRLRLQEFLIYFFCASIPAKFKLCLSDNFKQATICITPLTIDSNGRSVVRFRSFKTLRCAVTGVPVVSPSWIGGSKIAGEPLFPCGGLVARTLPSKTDEIPVDHWICGVAKIAAGYEQDSPLLMAGYEIIFARSLPIKLKKELGTLALAAGAVVSKRGATRNTLASLGTPTRDYDIVVVGDTPAGRGRIDDSIKIVDAAWIFDFILCARDPKKH